MVSHELGGWSTESKMILFNIICESIGDGIVGGGIFMT